MQSFKAHVESLSGTLKQKLKKECKKATSKLVKFGSIFIVQFHLHHKASKVNFSSPWNDYMKGLIVQNGSQNPKRPSQKIQNKTQ